MPELIEVVKCLDLCHVDEERDGAVVRMFWPLEEQVVPLVVNQPMTGDPEVLLSVREGESS